MDNTPNKALESVVRQLGGSKAVAPRIWPDKPVIQAQTLLCNCLNDERPEKLDFSQVLFILKLAKERGIHEGMEYIAEEVGYSKPQPIEPRDELAELLRVNLEAKREAQERDERIERLLVQLTTTTKPALGSAA